MTINAFTWQFLKDTWPVILFYQTLVVVGIMAVNTFNLHGGLAFNCGLAVGALQVGSLIMRSNNCEHKRRIAQIEADHKEWLAQAQLEEAAL